MSVTSSPGYRVTCLIVALLLAGLAFLPARLSLTFGPELKGWDLLFRARGPLPVRPDFLLVAGDEKSLQAYGQPPWPRRVFADVVRVVHSAGPKAIVLDYLFEERDKARRGSDAALWRAIAGARDVLLPVAHGDPDRERVTRDDLRGLVALEKSTVNSPFTRLNTTPDYGWLGFDPPVSDFAVSARGMGVSTVNDTADIDGVIRRTPTGWVSPIEYPAQPPLPEPSKLTGFTGVVPGLPVIAALFAFNLNKEVLGYAFGDHLQIAGSLKPPVVIPIDAAGHMVINYLGPAGRIPRVSLVDAARGQVSASTFKGRVVFIGMIAGSSAEVQALPTPYGSMPRVEITANAVHSILDRSYVFVETLRSPLGYLMAFAVVLGLVAPLFRPAMGMLATLLLLLLYFVVAIVVLRFWHVLLPVLPAVLLAVLVYLAALLLRPAFRGTFVAAE
jgi:adenylate cyclase